MSFNGKIGIAAATLLGVTAVGAVITKIITYVRCQKAEKEARMMNACITHLEKQEYDAVKKNISKLSLVTQTDKKQMYNCLEAQDYKALALFCCTKNTLSLKGVHRHLGLLK